MNIACERFAPKIARKLNVELSSILCTEDGEQVISCVKIAEILEARGEYSYLDKVCLADCLNAHYKGVTNLLDKYWKNL